MKFKKLLFLATRILAVILSFTLDIKVRAAATPSFKVIEQVGEVELDKNSDGTSDIQTFKHAFVRFSLSGTYVGVRENSFITVDNSQITLHSGSVFLRTKNSQTFVLQSKEGMVKASDNSEFLVTSSEGTTTLSVISGKATLGTRVKNNTQVLTGGYSSWVGGLLANGKRAEGTKEALDLRECQEALEVLGGIARKDLPVAVDHLRIAWKAAVDQVAENHQEDVTKNMTILENWLIEKRKKFLKEESLRLRIKEYFRAQTLDKPDQNREFPSESPRVPASGN